MLSGPSPLSTILVLHPDVVSRHLPKLLRRIGQERFTVVGMKLGMLEEEQLQYLMLQSMNQVSVK